MKTLRQNKDLFLQNYGAAELIAYSQKATYRAFGITVLILGLLFLMFYLFKSQPLPLADQSLVFNPLITETINYKTKSPDLTFTMQEPSSVAVHATGTEEVTGYAIPVKSEKLEITPVKFASTENISISSANPGTAKSILDIIPSGKGTGSNNSNNIQQSGISPIFNDDKIYVYTDKEPEVDLVNLQKNIIYPELPRKAGIEGKVVVNALIGTNGEVLKAKIESSTNSLLEDAAITAVMTPGLYKPAILEGKPVLCWISIPINFRLR
jgi:TonB family protein